MDEENKTEPTKPHYQNYNGTRKTKL